MSVAIEQRLREMELVHDMLQIAMAEEGAEDDDVKEDYAKRADETLAAMRVQLEEARRNEGKPPIEPTAKQSLPSTSAVPTDTEVEGAPQQQYIESPASLKAELITAHSKVSPACWPF